jgi:CRP-like cAMP-binding protein
MDSQMHFLSDAGIELDADPARIHVYQPMQTVMSAGERSDWFGFVLSGELSLLDEAGQPVGTVDAGGIVGEIGVLTGRPRTATLVARVRSTLWVGNEADLLTVFASSAGSAWLAKLAATRLADAVDPVVVRTVTGVRAVVRPALPSDGPALRQELRLLSRESIRMRFFSASQPPESVIDYLLDADHFNHAVWVALDENETPVGSVRCIRSSADPAQAELAIGLADRVHGNGLGGLLVGVIGQVAVALGIARLTAETLSDNEPMRRLLRTPSTTTTHSEPGVLHSTLDPADLASRLTPTSRETISAATKSIVDGVYSVSAAPPLPPEAP